MSEGLGFVLSHPKRPTTPRTRTCPWGPRAARLGWGTRTAAAHVQDAYDAIGCAVWPSSRLAHKPITIHNPFSMRLWEPCVIPPELASTRRVIQISSFTHPRFRKRDKHATRLSCGTLRGFPLFRAQLRVLLFICISSHTLLTPSRGRLRRAAIASA